MTELANTAPPVSAPTVGRHARALFITKQVFTIVLFLVGVMACYRGAIVGRPWLGPAIVLAILGIHVLIDRERWLMLKLVAIVTVVTFVFESVVITTGLYTPEPATRWLMIAPLCPLWLLALWVNFAAKLVTTALMLRDHYLRGSLLGVLFGLIIFQRAEAMHVLRLNHGLWSLVIIAVLWGLMLPVLLRLTRAMLGLPARDPHPVPAAAPTANPPADSDERTS